MNGKVPPKDMTFKTIGLEPVIDPVNGIYYLRGP